MPHTDDKRCVYIYFFLLLAGAMKALFAKGIVHRDLKPQNILLSHNCGKSLPSPENITLKIADVSNGSYFYVDLILILIFYLVWFRTVSTRGKYGSNIMWEPNVHGSRSHNVSPV